MNGHVDSLLGFKVLGVELLLIVAVAYAPAWYVAAVGVLWGFFLTMVVHHALSSSRSRDT